jgi:hypothetical protein
LAKRYAALSLGAESSPGFGNEMRAIAASFVCLTLLTTILPASEVHAEATQAKPEMGCPERGGSALAEIACELARALTPGDHRVVVALAPLESDHEVTAQEALENRLCQIVAGRLGGRCDEGATSLGRALSRRSTDKLVYLKPTITRGNLTVSADQYRMRRGFWERILSPRPAPEAHAFATRPVDPEIQSFLATVGIVISKVHKAPAPERSLVAVGCGDVGADGSPDIVAVGRHRIVRGRLRGSTFLREAETVLGDVSPVAAAPLRQPLATAVVAPDGSLFVGSSDRARGHGFDANGRPLAELVRRFPWPGGGCVELEGLGFSSSIAACRPGERTSEHQVFPEARAFDAIGGAEVLSRSGELRRVRAARLLDQTEVWLSDGMNRSARIGEAGAQVAVGDLDNDGQPEIVLSLPTLEASEDAIVVKTWADDGSIVERLRHAAPGGVRALAICPRHGTGMTPIVAAVGEELWVLT